MVWSWYASPTLARYSHSPVQKRQLSTLRHPGASPRVATPEVWICFTAHKSHHCHTNLHCIPTAIARFLRCEDDTKGPIPIRIPRVEVLHHSTGRLSPQIPCDLSCRAPTTRDNSASQQFLNGSGFVGDPGTPDGECLHPDFECLAWWGACATRSKLALPVNEAARLSAMQQEALEVARLRLTQFSP